MFIRAVIYAYITKRWWWW